MKWATLRFIDAPVVVIPHLITLTRTYNTGIAFGLAKGFGIFNLIAALLIVGWILWFYKKEQTHTLPLALIIGGAIGNIIDRILYYPNGVLDMISVPWFSVFNLADAAITLGAIILLIELMKKKD